MRQIQRFFKPYFLCFCWVGLSAVSGAFPAVTKLQDTTVSSSAMTLGSGALYGYAINGLSFQQDVLITYNGWQYITYYNSSRYVCVGRRQLPSGSWQVITLTDYTLSTTTDAHNVVTMGICPNDGTIHLSFDNHHGGTLDYRVSETGVATDPGSITWSAALFKSVRSYLESGKTYSSVTYPQFLQTPDGNMQFNYRIDSSGNGDWAMVDYNAATGLWSNTRTVISRTGTYSDSQISNSIKRNPYMNGPMAYGPDGTLHATWCWRETATGTANHDILYAYSKDGGVTWYNNNPPSNLRIGTANNPLQGILRFSWLNDGLQIVGDTSIPQTIYLNSPGINAVTLDSYYGLMNQQAQAIDPQGRIHVVMFHCSDESYISYPRGSNIWGLVGARRYFHYWRDDKGVWTRNELPGYVGSRPKIFFRPNGDVYAIYQSWQTVNPSSAAIYITNGNLVIQAATAATQWTDWQIIHTETGPFLNEMLADSYRFQEGVLSVMVQNSPGTIGASTPLRVIDFQLND
jgi:hypothetical protein